MHTMEKLDLTRLYKPYYTAKNKPELLEIEPAKFISIDGRGDPSGSGFQADIQALYALAYTLKFISKEAGKDFVVAKLEGLWQFDEKAYGEIKLWEAPVLIPRRDWEYRLLIRIPAFISATDVEKAKEKLPFKKPGLQTDKLKYVEQTEGRSVQILHKGPFQNEPATLKLMDEFMIIHGLSRNGMHHEIYLSDFRKTDPEKLRTILRQPVK